MQHTLWVLKNLNASLVTTSLHISHLLPPHDLQEPFFFSSSATFALTRISFKLLALLNPTIGILSKNFPCSLLLLTVSVFQIIHISRFYIYISNKLITLFHNSHIQKVYFWPGVFYCKLYSRMIAIKML